MIYQLAGLVGIDPGPMTLRELLWMAQGRIEQTDRLLWNHTSSVLAMLINTMPFRKSTTLAEPRDFHPYEHKRAEKGFPITADSISMLKAFLPAHERTQPAAQKKPPT